MRSSYCSPLVLFSWTLVPKSCSSAHAACCAVSKWLPFPSDSRIWYILAESITSKQANIPVHKSRIILWLLPSSYLVQVQQLVQCDFPATSVRFWPTFDFVFSFWFDQKTGDMMRPPSQLNLSFTKYPASHIPVELCLCHKPWVPCRGKEPWEYMLSSPCQVRPNYLEVCKLQTWENWARISQAAHLIHNWS